ncbi:MAG: phosphoribosylformylglycinamidine synthase subunit PurS, partial [Bdellovibrionota bacterium]
SQGRAVAKILNSHGKKIENCRVGRYVIIEVAETDKNKAIAKAQEMAEFVLYNPLIETFELEVL